MWSDFHDLIEDDEERSDEVSNLSKKETIRSSLVESFTVIAVASFYRHKSWSSSEEKSIAIQDNDPGTAGVYQRRHGSGVFFTLQSYPRNQFEFKYE